MEKGLEQEEFCAYGGQNVESVILMSTGSFFFLLHFHFIYVFFSLLHILNIIMSCIINI